MLSSHFLVSFFLKSILYTKTEHHKQAEMQLLVHQTINMFRSLLCVKGDERDRGKT